MTMISLSNTSSFLSHSCLPITKSISHSVRRESPKFKLRRGGRCCCVYTQNGGTQDKKKESQLDWPILKKWDVPWEWQTVSLTSLACGLSFVLTGLTEAAAIPYLGIKYTELSLDEKAELLFVDQAFTTAVVLAVLYSLTNTFQPRDDLYRYDLKDPFDLKKGWLLWAGIGLTGAVIAIALTGVVMSFFNGESPDRKTDALAMLLPLIGSSSVSTACLIGVTGIFAPVLEENVFRGFLMVSLTKWHISTYYNLNDGVLLEDSYVEVLAASQTLGEFGKRSFQGTADAVRQFQWLFEDATSKDIEDVLILTGDHLYHMDYRDFDQNHRESGVDITISCLPVDDNRASDFR